ncbi:hypothetical protein [Geosporobacter ferrireducens]|uniref:Uncharacterized protein n=1 Tax=Geosporobacter ferrireducens TaxID=1424294 RepID=A0A1D8GJ28_9FIRM|nr:hypothetical protein [Geosporobacter ferrireducens]AOT70925.1 hypothetical protein Gferi_15965 [Geosporobacter ferrireducens]MTI53631.1 hypothetical protein [Geosporobacter ferrireducens]
MFYLLKAIFFLGAMISPILLLYSAITLFIKRDKHVSFKYTFLNTIFFFLGYGFSTKPKGSLIYLIFILIAIGLNSFVIVKEFKRE